MWNSECIIFGTRPCQAPESVGKATRRRTLSAISIPYSACRHSSSGQALVEFTVALIVIVALLAGLVQIGQITNAHTQTMIDARTEAAEAAMSEAYAPSADARYMYAWFEGADKKRYTRDDTAVCATNAVDSVHAIYGLARPDELTTYRTNDLSRLGASEDNVDEFFLVRGYKSDSCPTLPAIRKLAYDKETISLESYAWLVWTEGIY